MAAIKAEASRPAPVATAAQVLYLVNLMLLPGLAFLMLLSLYFLYRRHENPLVVNHLSQTVGTSLVGGSVLVLVIVSILALGGFDSGHTWVMVVLYFTFVHTSLIFCGVLGLVKALAGQRFTVPLIGRWFTT